jgi:endonuclease III
MTTALPLALRHELFRRFQAANPHPATELNYTSPFELLIAVMLSAQATDISVNKATQQLFPVANTPEKILALGEVRLIDYIKTIGLYRSKAKHIIGTCERLLDLHQGQVPRQREALQQLPGVGRKTANVVLNCAFGEPTIAVDTHIFRVARRLGLSRLCQQNTARTAITGSFCMDATHAKPVRPNAGVAQSETYAATNPKPLTLVSLLENVFMDAFLNSLALVGLGELGDKTQVVALLLAMRYKKPWPIILGILAATIVAMGAATALGVLIGKQLDPQLLRWVLGIAFIAVAIWTLVPEKEEENEETAPRKPHALIVTAFIAFLVAELGDKSQAATLVLAAKYQAWWPVLAGSVVGEMLAIVPAVLIGKTTAAFISPRIVQWTAAALFAGLGVWMLWGG